MKLRITVRFTLKELFYIIIALLFFFQIYLQNTIGIMQYFDEIVTVCCLGVILLYALYGKLEKAHIKLLLLCAVAATIGLLNNFIAGLRTELVPIVTDIGNSYKVFVVYIGSSLYLRTVYNKQRIIKVLSVVIHIFVVITFICMVLHEVGVVTMGNDVRFGLNSFQFINNGAGQLSFMFYAVVLILTLEIKNQAYKKRLLYIALALIVWCSTLRSRAFMYVFIYVVLYFILIKQKLRFELNWKTGLVIIFVLFLFGMDQIETYFVSKQTARAHLLRYGVRTMFDYFPFGTGFATYGTDAAVKYYSPLYYLYGFDSVWGLSESNPIFAHDTYWPAIFAQFGFVGTAVMIYLIYCWCMDILNRSKYNRYCYLAAIFIAVTQVSSSVATATFFHFVTVGLAFLIPLLFEGKDTRRKINNEPTNSLYSHV